MRTLRTVIAAVLASLVFDLGVTVGAYPRTVLIVEVDEVPLAYLPGNAVGIRVKAVGDLRIDERQTGDEA